MCGDWAQLKINLFAKCIKERNCMSSRMCLSWVLLVFFRAWNNISSFRDIRQDMKFYFPEIYLKGVCMLISVMIGKVRRKKKVWKKKRHRYYQQDNMSCLEKFWCAFSAFSSDTSCSGVVMTKYFLNYSHCQIFSSILNFSFDVLG